MLIKNILVFINFTNFYYQFIKSFSKKVILFILILKTTRLFDWLSLKTSKAGNNKFDNNFNNNTRLQLNFFKSKKMRKLKNI